MTKTVALSILLVLFGGCDGAANAPPPHGAQPVSVTVTEVSWMEIADRRERVGQLQAIEDVELRARIEGFLEQRLFEEGSDVDKGDLLYVIERAPYEAEVARTEAELASDRAALQKAQLDLERSRELRKKGSVSQALLDESIALERQAAANVLARKAELRHAQLDLGYTEIRAPLSGRIGRSEYSVGDLVEPESGTLATIVMLDPIHVYWTVGEQVLLDARRAADIPEITATLVFQHGRVYEHRGKLNFLDNRVDPSTGTQELRALFPNPKKLLLPGQYVTVVVQVGKEQSALVIPQSAIQEDLSGRFVLVVDDNNVASVRRVTMGARHQIFWVVEDGLEEGERIIYQGTQKVTAGATVTPIVLSPNPPATG